MLSDKILKLLNDQIKIEAESSQLYLAMYSWAMKFGLEGVAKFMLDQSDEERKHMLKIFSYICDQGEIAKVPQLDAPAVDFVGIQEVFTNSFEHETFVTSRINDLVIAATAEKDITTAVFLNWFVIEQIEEEATVKRILEKIKWIKGSASAMFMVDNFIKTIR